MAFSTADLAARQPPQSFRSARLTS